jgi:hypothetical protein
LGDVCDETIGGDGVIVTGPLCGALCAPGMTGVVPTLLLVLGLLRLHRGARG